jgi:D-alanyl-D-alanine carboxypeptidase (penicillin-binding protein 5/6)
MRIVEPHEFKNVKHPKETRSSNKLLRGALLAVVVLYVAVSLLRPLPPVMLTSSALSPTSTKQPTISWPSYGQAAIGAVGYGTLGTHGEVKSLPTASVAKVMTALAVLTKKPLSIGEQGPVITITQDDVDEYNKTIAMDGSNVPVVVGEQITQYEALQALLLPSANNMAYTLAKWAYGSEQEYLLFVNNFAKSLGMQNTNFDDTSGYSAGTVSTAQDLVKLAVNAMDNPVIAEITAQPEATIPIAGKIYNVNGLLGKDGIVGVKTGKYRTSRGLLYGGSRSHDW